MTSISIQSATPSSSDYSTSNTPAKTSSAKPETTSAVPQDEVKLSVAAQAKLLEHQGQSVAQIASNLAVSKETVESDLGVTSTSTSQAQSLVAMLTGS
jgi:hypothetical protein